MMLRSALPRLLCGALLVSLPGMSALADSAGVSRALDALNSVHASGDGVRTITHAHGPLPDGRTLVISAAHGSGDDNWWIAELDLCDAGSGAVTTLAKPPLQIASPRWSGDGKRIAWIGGKHDDQVDVMTRLVGWFDQYLKP